MKIYAISDLHLSFNCNKPMDVFGGNWEGYIPKIEENWKSKITDDDIVLIAGDISWAMKLEEVNADLNWIDNLPGKKIMIKGNHEYWWKSISSVRAILPSSILAIQNDSIKIGNFVFCGTRGWTIPEECNKPTEEDIKIYKREVERLKLTLMSAKTACKSDEQIIAMIHYPPFGTLEFETEFTKLFEEYGVSIVIFGHIHGKTNCPKVCMNNGVKYYFTACDHIDNNPVLIYE